METLVIIFVILLSVIGLLGCVVPGLPGPPLNLAALLLVHFFLTPVNGTTLLILGLLTVIIIVLDYIMPPWFSKKYGATRMGITGSIIGMVVGLFFTPVGMILGTLLGAVIGDLLAGSSGQQAVKSGAATLLGTLLSIGLKLIISGLLLFYTVLNLVRYFSDAGTS